MYNKKDIPSCIDNQKEFCKYIGSLTKEERKMWGEDVQKDWDEFKAIPRGTTPYTYTPIQNLTTGLYFIPMFLFFFYGIGHLIVCGFTLKFFGIWLLIELSIILLGLPVIVIIFGIGETIIKRHKLRKNKKQNAVR